MDGLNVERLLDFGVRDDEMMELDQHCDETGQATVYRISCQ